MTTWVNLQWTGNENPSAVTCSARSLRLWGAKLVLFLDCWEGELKFWHKSPGRLVTSIRCHIWWKQQAKAGCIRAMWNYTMFWDENKASVTFLCGSKSKTCNFPCGVPGWSFEDVLPGTPDVVWVVCKSLQFSDLFDVRKANGQSSHNRMFFQCPTLLSYCIRKKTIFHCVLLHWQWHSFAKWWDFLPPWIQTKSAVMQPETRGNDLSAGTLWMRGSIDSCNKLRAVSFFSRTIRTFPRHTLSSRDWSINFSFNLPIAARQNSWCFFRIFHKDLCCFLSLELRKRGKKLLKHWAELQRTCFQRQSFPETYWKQMPFMLFCHPARVPDRVENLAPNFPHPFFFVHEFTLAHVPCLFSQFSHFSVISSLGWFHQMGTILWFFVWIYFTFDCCNGTQQEWNTTSLSYPADINMTCGSLCLIGVALVNDGLRRRILFSSLLQFAIFRLKLKQPVKQLWQED